MDTVIKVVGKIVAFLAPVAGSIKGHLNAAELARVTVTALISGGGLVGLLTAYQGDLSQIFVNPADSWAGILGVVLTVAIEAVRRLDHGTPVPAAGPVVSPDDGFPK